MYTVENLEKRYLASVDSINESLICLQDLYDELQEILDKYSDEDKESTKQDLECIEDARKNIYQAKSIIKICKNHINQALKDMTLYY